MTRIKKQKIEVNDNDSLQGMMQEVYNNVCDQIQDAQKVINEVGAGAMPTDIDDIVKIAKAKTDALKLKEGAIKTKLEISKLQNEIIKHNGNAVSAISANPEIVEIAAFDKIRQMIKDKQAGGE